MTMAPDSDHYEKAQQFAEAGRYEDALDSIEQHLRSAPDDAEALNDAGAILHCLGRSAEAIEYLRRADDLQSDSAEIIWNLAEACLAADRPDEAAQLFGRMQYLNILSADILNRAANAFLKRDNKADAVEMLLRSLSLAPEQEILKPMIEVIRSKRPKITFFADSADVRNSLKDVYRFAERRFSVRLFEDLCGDRVYELMKSSDICWFEGCPDLVVEASAMPKVCKNIVRLHEPGPYRSWPQRVRWENIDAVITVENSSVREVLVQQSPDAESRTWIITVPTGVNLDEFTFIDRQQGGSLACVDTLSPAGNCMMLLQCMQKLHYIDPQYRLFFAGTFRDPALQSYVMHIVGALGLTEVVFFDGPQQDLASWLQDKHYIVSGSIEQGRHRAILQAMACGLKPVVHNSPAAARFLPAEFLFNISEQFCEQVLSDRYEPQNYRRLVEENHPPTNELSKVNAVLTQFEAEIDLENTAQSLRDELTAPACAGSLSSPQPASHVSAGEHSDPRFPNGLINDGQ